MATAKTSLHTVSRARDGWLVGLRVAYILGLSALLYWVSYQNGSYALEYILRVGVISLVANLLIVPFLFIPPLTSRSDWMVMMGDWITIATFTYLIYDKPTQTVAVMGILLPLTVARLGSAKSTLHLMVSVVVFAGMLFFRVGMNNLPDQWTLGVTPVVVASMGSIGIILMVYYRERVFAQEHDTIIQNTAQAQQLVQEMQAQTTAIADMAQMLSSSLNYHRVLEAALGVGQLAMRDKSGGFLSMVLLYRAEDRNLFTLTGMGISRRDRGRLIKGRDGLVREALTLCEPVFGGAARNDPELDDYVSLQRVRSVVVVPLRAGFDNFGVMIFASRKPNAFQEEYRSYLQAIGTQTTIALQNAALYQNLLTEKERIIDVDKVVRKRIARELHDGPTQDVSAIMMHTSIGQRYLEQSNHNEALSEFAKIQQIADQAVKEIRLMLYALRPYALEGEEDSGGLPKALDQLADKYISVYDQHVEVNVSGQAEQMLTEPQSDTIFNIVQEALNNARKHAKASMIRVSVYTYQENIVLEIVDNGVGFNVERERQAARARNSLGMQNLYDQADLLDGTLNVESAPGEGTRIILLIPVDARALAGRDQAHGKRERFRLSAIR